MLKVVNAIQMDWLRAYDRDQLESAGRPYWPKTTLDLANMIYSSRIGQWHFDGSDEVHGQLVDRVERTVTKILALAFAFRNADSLCLAMEPYRLETSHIGINIAAYNSYQQKGIACSSVVAHYRV